MKSYKLIICIIITFYLAIGIWLCIASFRQSHIPKIPVWNKLLTALFIIFLWPIPVIGKTYLEYLQTGKLYVHYPFSLILDLFY